LTANELGGGDRGIKRLALRARRVKLEAMGPAGVVPLTKPDELSPGSRLKSTINNSARYFKRPPPDPDFLPQPPEDSWLAVSR
jgi:hypothetical protein